MSLVQTPENRGPECVSLLEAGRLLGVCGRTVRREIDRGKLRAFRAGWKWKIRMSELRRYMQCLVS